MRLTDGPGEMDLTADQRNQLNDTIERIESLTAEKAETAELIKAEYDSAAGMGFDKKAIRQLLKDRAAGNEKTVIHRRTVSIYRRALAGLVGTPLGDWARQWTAQEARYERRAAETSAMDEFMGKRRAAPDQESPPPK